MPIGATAFPTVSKDGKTYTFHIRPGLKFSDGSAVTAASYQRSWERILSPKMGSPLGVNLSLQDDIVGGQAFLDGKAAKISGISAKGLTLTFHLTSPNATFVSILSMQWFTAVKANTAVLEHRPQRLPGSRPVLHRLARPGPLDGAEAEPVLQGQPPGEPRPDRVHAEREHLTSRCCRSRPASPTWT